MRRDKKVNPRTVLVQLTLLVEIRVKQVGNRRFGCSVVEIPLHVLVRLPRGPDMGLRRRIVHAALRGDLPASWRN